MQKRTTAGIAVTIKMDKPLWKAASDKAREQEKSFSLWMEEAVKAWLEREAGDGKG